MARKREKKPASVVHSKARFGRGWTIILGHFGGFLLLEYRSH